MNNVGEKIRYIANTLLALGILGAIVIWANTSYVFGITSIISMIILWVFMYGLGELIDWAEVIYSRLGDIERHTYKIRCDIENQIEKMNETEEE